MAFLRADPDVIDAWAHAGLDFYRMDKDRVRLVTSFRSTPEQIDEALRRIDGTASSGGHELTAPQRRSFDEQVERDRTGRLARRCRSG